MRMTKEAVPARCQQFHVDVPDHHRCLTMQNTTPQVHPIHLQHKPNIADEHRMNTAAKRRMTGSIALCLSGYSNVIAGTSRCDACITSATHKGCDNKATRAVWNLS